MRILLIKAIRAYQEHLSPQYGGGCVFTPSCSEYAIECIRQHGALVGLRLTVSRLLRCRPGFPCGNDPVPERNEIRTALGGQLVAENPEKKGELN